MGLVQQFNAYSAWRSSLSKNIVVLREWLCTQDLSDPQTLARLDNLVERLRGDKLTIAFVAEFSRGKSELINALFFADFGQRILPSSSGRTTMCPTELEYQDGKPPRIDLLPIETRGKAGAISDFRGVPEAWVSENLNISSAEALQKSLAKVGEQKRVSKDEAERLGFEIDESGENGLKPDLKGQVEIPAWRHAVINFPHPLLEQGLVVLDTPGLNAIGAEPELTLSLLPSAHGVLFILAADTGVTHSDLEVWRHHVTNSSARGRLVVLNKIDGLWDGLRTEQQINAEIDKQLALSADTLNVSKRHIFPVSAQKALVAKVQKDAALLQRSRIAELEEALTREILPAKREIVTDSVRSEANEIASRTLELLRARMANLTEQNRELADLRGKNQASIRYLLLKVKTEKDEFEQGLQQYYAVRSVFTKLTNRLFLHLGMDGLRGEIRATKEAMLASTFSRGLRTAMANFFAAVRGRLRESVTDLDEIATMLNSMYKRFGVENGVALEMPQNFALGAYQKELDRLEASLDTHFSVLVIVTQAKRTLTQQLFESVAVQIRRTFETANRDIDAWLRNGMAPLESHVRDQQQHLKRRLDNVKQLNESTEDVDTRLAELKLERDGLQAKLADLGAIQGRLEQAYLAQAGSQENLSGNKAA